jgi:hypothetical protein
MNINFLVVPLLRIVINVVRGVIVVLLGVVVVLAGRRVLDVALVISPLLGRCYHSA